MSIEIGHFGGALVSKPLDKITMALAIQRHTYERHVSVPLQCLPDHYLRSSGVDGRLMNTYFKYKPLLDVRALIERTCNDDQYRRGVAAGADPRRKELQIFLGDSCFLSKTPLLNFVIDGKDMELVQKQLLRIIPMIFKPSQLGFLKDAIVVLTETPLNDFINHHVYSCNAAYEQDINTSPETPVWESELKKFSTPVVGWGGVWNTHGLFFGNTTLMLATAYHHSKDHSDNPDFLIAKTVIHELMHLLNEKNAFPVFASLSEPTPLRLELVESQHSSGFYMADNFKKCPDLDDLDNNSFTGELLSDLSTLVFKSRFAPNHKEMEAAQLLLTRILNEDADLTAVYKLVFVSENMR